jgi:putative NADPH-quinone reductase
MAMAAAAEKAGSMESDLVSAHEAIMAADHLVIVFPPWLGDLPAILKGFLERVLQPSVLPGAQAGKFATPLTGKSARIIVTMGMPALVSAADGQSPRAEWDRMSCAP